MARSDTETLDLLLTEVARIVRRDRVDPDATIAMIGIDSLNIVELIIACYALYPGARDRGLIALDEGMTLREIHERMPELTAPH